MPEMLWKLRKSLYNIICNYVIVISLARCGSTLFIKVADDTSKHNFIFSAGLTRSQMTEKMSTGT